LKRERKYKFIEGQLHQQNKQGWVVVPFEYHTIDEITPTILRQLKKIANKKVTFAVEKDIESDDLVSDFLYQVTEGFLPLRKTKGVNFDTVVYSRFTNNYLKDYYKSKDNESQISEDVNFENIPDQVVNEKTDIQQDVIEGNGEVVVKGADNISAKKSELETQLSEKEGKLSRARSESRKATLQSEIDGIKSEIEKLSEKPAEEIKKEEVSLQDIEEVNEDNFDEVIKTLKEKGLIDNPCK